MSDLKTYEESEGLMPFGDDYFFGNLKGDSSALFVNPAGKQLTIHTCIAWQAIDTVQLAAYTFIGFILGVVMMLLLQLVAFMFRDKKMTGVIDLE